MNTQSTTTTPTAATLIAATFMAILAACGSGGGGGGGSSTTGTASATTAPGAPAITSATAGDAAATINFAAPASNGGSAISNYTVTCTAAGASQVSANGGTSPLVVTGLVNGTTYSCSVTAINAVGTSVASGSVSVTPAAAATVPGAPTIGSASAGNASATINFTASASNGGSAITGYTASCSAAGGAFTGNGTASPITVSGLTNGVAYACSVAARNSVGLGASSATVGVTPVAPTSATIDPTKLPVGDTKVTTTTAQVGYVYGCPLMPGGGGASTTGPRFNADGSTWNSTLKIAVQGAVSWASSFAGNVASTLRNLTGNGLPSHTTGTYPIAASDPAYVYDRNPNSIATQTVAWGLPANPTANATPTCLSGGAIGILLTGARLFNALDGESRDAVAWEMQDACQGHPERTGAYHYHNISSCVQQDTAGQHSPLVGYARDGFGIYGNLGENGQALTNADLDVCHGHTHAITVNGQTVTQYHYHATKEFPYSLGCFRGTPVNAS